MIWEITFRQAFDKPGVVRVAIIGNADTVEEAANVFREKHPYSEVFIFKEKRGNVLLAKKSKKISSKYRLTLTCVDPWNQCEVQVKLNQDIMTLEGQYSLASAVLEAKERLERENDNMERDSLPDLPG